MKTAIFSILICLSTLTAIAQGFHFGAELFATSSQIEGDKLRGFHHHRYAFGLIGGYTFNNSHYLIISPQYARFGSQRKGERFSNEINQISVEMDIATINSLFGYSYRFGDTWTEEKKYRLNAGLRVHRLLKAENNILKSGIIENIIIDKEEDLRNYFLTLEIGLGLNLPKHFALELNYNHSLHNLLLERKANVTKLAPFYLSLGVSYSFFSTEE